MENQIQKHVETSLTTFKYSEVSTMMKIRDEDSFNSIRQALRYVFVLVGLKKPPKDEFKMVLINFIIKKYGGYAPEEIKIAFELAIEGRLDLTDKQVTHFQDFSSQYFARIMNAYKDYRNIEMKKVIDMKKPDVKLLAPSKMNHFKTALFPRYDELVKGRTYLSQFAKIDGYLFYDSLDEIGLMNFTTDEKNKLWNELCESMGEWYKKMNRSAPDKPTKQHGKNEAKHRMFKSWIQDHAKKKTDLEKLIYEAFKKL